MRAWQPIISVVQHEQVPRPRVHCSKFESSVKGGKVTFWNPCCTKEERNKTEHLSIDLRLLKRCCGLNAAKTGDSQPFQTCQVLIGLLPTDATAISFRMQNSFPQSLQTIWVHRGQTLLGKVNSGQGSWNLNDSDVPAPWLISRQLFLAKINFFFLRSPGFLVLNLHMSISCVKLIVYTV